MGGEGFGDGSKCGSASSGRERYNAWKAGEPRIQESLYKVGKGPCLDSWPLPVAF